MAMKYYQHGFCGHIHFRKANFKGRWCHWENHIAMPAKTTAGQTETMSVRKGFIYLIIHSFIYL